MKYIVSRTAYSPPIIAANEQAAIKKSEKLEEDDWDVEIDCEEWDGE